MKLIYPSSIRRLGAGIIPSRVQILLDFSYSLERAYRMSKSWQELKKIKQVQEKLIEQLGDK